jgi:hypothetical protein
VVSQAGAVLLVETARKAGLDAALSTALAPWSMARAVHDPGKVLLDLALAVALGGDCLADIGMLRAEPDLFGSVASDPTVSRLIGQRPGGPAVSGDDRAGAGQGDGQEHRLVGVSGAQVEHGGRRGAEGDEHRLPQAPQQQH